MDRKAHLDLLRRAWETLSRRDLDAHLAFYDPEVRIRPAFAVGSDAGWLDGLDGVRRGIENVWETYETWEGSLEQLLAIGDHALTLLRLEARGRASGVELSGLFAQVVTVRHGRIVRLMNFLEIPDAFEEMARLLRQTSA